MKTTIKVTWQGDVFEVKLRGYIIARITCYMSSCYRQDMQFDDLPEAVKDLIEKEISKFVE